MGLVQGVPVEALGGDRKCSMCGGEPTYFWMHERFVYFCTPCAKILLCGLGRDLVRERDLVLDEFVKEVTEAEARLLKSRWGNIVRAAERRTHQHASDSMYAENDIPDYGAWTFGTADDVSGDNLWVGLLQLLTGEVDIVMHMTDGSAGDAIDRRGDHVWFSGCCCHGFDEELRAAGLPVSVTPDGDWTVPVSDLQAYYAGRGFRKHDPPTTLPSEVGALVEMMLAVPSEGMAGGRPSKLVGG
ncbi:MAG: hypothetical protein A2Y38_10435 [Spirochaetes bacterium GWB1_59_5]|nr:MAG: hypothetical protein A2Y38_10435 [Spirochaetes bacterium GWB1_59_5]